MCMFLNTFLMIGTTELLLIGGIALLLFGGKKLPELMRGMGRGVKNFKEGLNGVETETDEAVRASEKSEADMDASKDSTGNSVAKKANDIADKQRM